MYGIKDRERLDFGRVVAPAETRRFVFVQNEFRRIGVSYKNAPQRMYTPYGPSWEILFGVKQLTGRAPIK